MKIGCGVLKNVSIIIPVYNGERYLKLLHDNIKKQKFNGNIEIIVPVSPSRDKSLEVATQLFDVAYTVEDFNHGKTRHEAALKAKNDILIFMTQDVTPYDENWLSELVNGLQGDVVATFSRQIAYENSSSLERIIRNFNYPEKSRICNLKTKQQWQRKNIFYSDASSSTIKEYFLAIGGYDFNCNTNEDVIYASKVIDSGKSILYNANSKVFHSHDFKIKELWNRYYSIGEFEKKYTYLFSDYNSTGEGMKLVKYATKQLLTEGEFLELIRFLFVDCPIRFIAYKLGLNHK